MGLSRDLRFVSKLVILVWLSPLCSSNSNVANDFVCRFRPMKQFLLQDLDFQNSHSIELRDSVYESLPFSEFGKFGRTRPKWWHLNFISFVYAEYMTNSCSILIITNLPDFKCHKKF